jgi:hypothetical protein
MSGLLDGIDITDPCAVWPKLQQAYYELVAGSALVRSRFDKREVEFKPADTKALGLLVAQLKADCERRSHESPRRFAIRAGFRPRY